jgi:antitoxin component of RelBE/YafQ-DinJ toxin-antitoxin module
MNQKDAMMLHVRIEPEDHKKMKHICVDLDISMQDYVRMLIKKGNEKNE